MIIIINDKWIFILSYRCYRNIWNSFDRQGLLTLLHVELEAAFFLQKKSFEGVENTSVNITGIHFHCPRLLKHGLKIRETVVLSDSRQEFSVRFRIFGEVIISTSKNSVGLHNNVISWLFRKLFYSTSKIIDYSANIVANIMFIRQTYYQ